MPGLGAADLFVAASRGPQHGISAHLETWLQQAAIQAKAGSVGSRVGPSAAEGGLAALGVTTGQNVGQRGTTAVPRWFLLSRARSTSAGKRLG
jgi:hypothetical protein